MPFKPEKKKEYDRKRYELMLLRTGKRPTVYTNLDAELEKARANFHPVGGRFAIGEPLETEPDFDDTENVSEADYNPKHYYDFRYKPYFTLSTAELDEMERELESIAFKTIRQVIGEIKKRLSDFKYMNVDPVRKRVIVGILSELKRDGLFIKPDNKKLARELDNYF